MFLLKKIIGEFLMPVPVMLGLFAIGLSLLLFTRRQRAAKAALGLAAVLFLLAGYGFLSDTVLARLENRYPPVDVQAARASGVRWVVVLAGGHSTDSRLPATGQLAPETQVRLVEGVRIHRCLPDSKLLVSGGRIFDPQPTAAHMARLAEQLGVRPEDIVREDRSKDTHEEAVLIGPMLGRQPFILVTSACHMPRSMALFKARGMRPIPAPTCHYIHEDKALTLYDLFPRSQNIRKSEMVIHELLGILAAALAGQLQPYPNDGQ